MTERLYVAGAMSGIADFNFPLFFATAGALRGLGYEVENPADNDGSDLESALCNALERKGDWATYLKIDLPRLCRCDAVVALPGWRDSRGATLEVETARKLGMPIYRLDGGVLKPLIEIIGLSGYARSGKDSVAKVLVEEYGYTRLAFADTLREALYALDPMVTDDPDINWSISGLVKAMGWDRAKTGYPQVRTLLQRLGTEVGRDLIHPNVWVDATFAKMRDGGKYVISDVRFPNEADAVKQWGGEIWRIMRPDTGPANDHPSETALDDYLPDVRLYNDGTLDDLTVAVLELRLRDHVAA